MSEPNSAASSPRAATGIGSHSGGMEYSPMKHLDNSPPAHNIFTFDNIVFSSNFDNGNLGRVERVPNRPYEFRVWTAPDNMGTEVQSRHCAWFHFSVSGLPMGCVLRIQLVNASNHSGLYKHDMVNLDLNFFIFWIIFLLIFILFFILLLFFEFFFLASSIS